MKFLSENALTRIKLWALSKFCKTVELTQAQYDALTTEQKNDGTILYILTDVDPDNSGMRISWADYQALTPEQQANGTYYVYDYPNSEGNGQTISKAQWESMTQEQQSHGTYWVYDYDEDYIDAGQVTYGSTDVGSAISTLNHQVKIAGDAHYGTTAMASGYLKIRINSTIGWMLAFTLTVYRDYRASKFLISGYNYDSYHWYAPQVRHLGSSDSEKVEFNFGYDPDGYLWVAMPFGNYMGACIGDVCNGYQQVLDTENLFGIAYADSLSGTTQTTRIAQYAAPIFPD